METTSENTSSFVVACLVMTRQALRASHGPKLMPSWKPQRHTPTTLLLAQHFYIPLLSTNKHAVPVVELYQEKSWRPTIKRAGSCSSAIFLMVRDYSSLIRTRKANTSHQAEPKRSSSKPLVASVRSSTFAWCTTRKPGAPKALASQSSPTLMPQPPRCETSTTTI